VTVKNRSAPPCGVIPVVAYPDCPLTERLLWFANLRAVKYEYGARPDLNQITTSNAR
jgi:hypothetical protein